MKLMLIIFIFSLITFIKSEQNCADISSFGPEKCILSAVDKRTYDYCCYLDFKCVPLTQEEHETRFPNGQSDRCHNKEYQPRCEQINPTKASDCVKSSEDKGKYCCYTNVDLGLGSSDASCDIFEDDKEVETMKVLFGEDLVCPGYGNTNYTKYISIKNLILLLLLSLMLIF